MSKKKIDPEELLEETHGPMNSTAKEDAKVWARQQEREIDLGIEVANQDITLKTLLTRYQQEILPSKKNYQPDNYHINNILNHPIAALKIKHIK